MQLCTVSSTTRPGQPVSPAGSRRQQGQFTGKLFSSRNSPPPGGNLDWALGLPGYLIPQRQDFNESFQGFS